MRIFVAADYFLPGYKAGGAIQSLGNFARCFSQQHELFFFTRDRDSRDPESYESVRSDAWNERYGGSVYYASPGRIGKRVLQAALSDVEPDCVYLNSLFSPISRCFTFSRTLRRTMANRKVVLAVRGELNPGALAIRPVRKRVYLEYLRHTGVYRDIRFQASSDCEEVAIRRYFPDADVFVAGDIPSDLPKAIGDPATKHSGVCRFAFAARISPMKNLAFLLERLAELPDEPFHLDIYGPISDGDYWERCKPLTERLGEKVTVHGSYRPEKIWEILAKSRFMALPTLGENFGHSIYEAAASGTPYLISDRTPWTDRTTSGAGWALPLEDVDQWRRVLQECIHMKVARYAEMVDACRAAAAEVKSLAVVQHARLFD